MLGWVGLTIQAFLIGVTSRSKTTKKVHDVDARGTSCRLALGRTKIFE